MYIPRYVNYIILAKVNVNFEAKFEFYTNAANIHLVLQCKCKWPQKKKEFPHKVTSLKYF